MIMRAARPVREIGHRRILARFPRGTWMAALVLLLSLQAAAASLSVFGTQEPRSESAVVVIAITVTLAAIAFVLALMLLRVAADALAIAFGFAVLTDATLSTLGLLGQGPWLAAVLNLPPEYEPLVLMWPFAAIMLAGATYTTVAGRSRGEGRGWAGALAAGVLVALSVGLLRLLPGSIPDRADPTGLWLLPGLTLTQLTALCSLGWASRTRNNRLARYGALSLIPGVVAPLLLAFYGPGGPGLDAALYSATLLRGGMYLLIGIGVWTAIKDNLLMADRGRLSIGLSEQVREAVLGSVETDTIVRNVTRILGNGMDLDEVDVLLRTPGQSGLYVAAEYRSRKAPHGSGEEGISPHLLSLLHESLGGRASLTRTVQLSRTEVAIPLVAHDQQIGLLLAARRNLQGLHDSDLVLLEITSGHLAMGLANSQLLLESQSRLNRAEALRRLAVDTNRNIPLGELAETIVREAKHLTGMEAGELFLKDELTGHFLDHDSTLSGQQTRMPFGGIYDQVLETGRLVVRPGAQTSVAAPLISGNDVVGVLAVHSSQYGITVTEEEEITLAALADQSVIALERTRLAEQVEQNQRETETLYSIGKDISFVLSLEEGLQSVAERSRQILGCDFTAFLLLEGDDTCRVPAASGMSYSFWEENPTLDAGFVKEAAASDEPLEIENVDQEPKLAGLQASLGAERLISAVAVPLRANGQGLGVLLMGCRTRARFLPDQLLLAERVCRQTAVAIENARLLRAEQETVAKLRELDSIKSSVIRSASHELRTPLSMIKGYTDLLRETAGPELHPRQQKQLGTIARETDNVLGIIEDMITVFTLQTGALELQESRFPAQEALDEALAAVRAPAEAKAISLSLETEGPLPQLHADRPKLQQVLSNLLDNSLKFTQSGGSVKLLAEPQGRFLRVTVADTGPGVAPEDRARLFEAFHRGSHCVDEAVPGTGLGLAICKGIIDAHGGEIGLDPPRTQGASFWFTVPIAEPSD